jgi:hypothetical protein
MPSQLKPDATPVAQEMLQDPSLSWRRVVRAGRKRVQIDILENTTMAASLRHIGHLVPYALKSPDHRGQLQPLVCRVRQPVLDVSQLLEQET